ncbi:hypothetical protein JW868_03560, partial [Candidatus Woesearchaeota archaeon]|nr:hypothetical protein [Candidatus Woesearchaeota archaeon]
MLKKLFTNTRIIILVVFLILALVAIRPSFGASEGVTIRSIIKDSAAMHAQPPFELPGVNTPPKSKLRILTVNGFDINGVKEYYDVVNEMKVNESLTVFTSDGMIHKLTVEPIVEVIVTNETQRVNITEERINETTNETYNYTFEKEEPVIIENVVGVEDLGFNVYATPGTNVRKGLDLSGGTRVLLQPEEEVSPEQMDIVLSNIEKRLNVYGLSDIVVREAKDFEGSTYISVEIAGASKEEVRDLIARQGKFEAKINNDTVFRGGGDITSVCLTPSCSGIDYRRGCSPLAEGDWACSFFFSITITPDAADRQADLTEDLEIVAGESGSYLSADLELYLDDELVDVLKIGSELRGKP